jgi:hypothetical protein
MCSLWTGAPSRPANLGETITGRGLYCRLCRRRSRRIDGSRREERGNGEGEHEVFTHRFASPFEIKIVNVKHPIAKPADVIAA